MYSGPSMPWMRVALATDSTITSALAMVTASRVFSHGETHYRHQSPQLHKLDRRGGSLNPRTLPHAHPLGPFTRRRLKKGDPKKHMGYPFDCHSLDRERVAASDPIPSECHSIVVDRNGFKNSAASFDDGGRSNVVIVTSDKKRTGSFAPCDLDGFTQNGGGISPATKRPNYVVADVPRSEGEKGIQLKSDRRATHKLTINVGREKGRTSSVLWQVNPLPIALHEGDPFRPGHAWIKIEREKIKPSAFELSPRGKRWCFVGEAERPEGQWHIGKITASLPAPSGCWSDRYGLRVSRVWWL